MIEDLMPYAEYLVIQALRHLGQRHVDQTVIKKLRKRLGPKDHAQLLKDVLFAPAWIGEMMCAIATPGGDR